MYIQNIAGQYLYGWNGSLPIWVALRSEATRFPEADDAAMDEARLEEAHILFWLVP